MASTFTPSTDLADFLGDGPTPLTLGLLLSTGWVLAEPYLRDASHRWGALGLILISVFVMLRTKLSPMWLVALGSIVGALGWV